MKHNICIAQTISDRADGTCSDDSSGGLVITVAVLATLLIISLIVIMILCDLHSCTIK